jgi:GT2 family glycosyltransferase
VTVSVVIRSFNEGRHIGRLLIGLEKQTLQVDQVVLVDSGSTDDTVDIARKGGAEIHTIRPEDFSFGRSLNVGCAAATGDVIVIASAHVFPVYTTWIEHLVRPFADPRTALAYGRQVGDHTTKFSERQVLAKWFPEVSDPRQTHPFANNANSAIRRTLWSEQPYDESLTGLEDMDWAKRALERGHGLSYVADAAVVHLHDETIRQIANRYRREAIAHRRIFQDQELRLREAVRLAVSNIASDYGVARRERVLLANLAGIPAFRSAQFWGAYQGFRQRGPVTDELRRHFYYPRDPRIEPERSTPGERIDYTSLEGRVRAAD